LKGSDDLRGRIDLWPFDGKNRDMRGFWLDPELHGRGLMTEAANAVTAFAFEQLNWPFLYLTNAVANRSSARVKDCLHARPGSRASIKGKTVVRTG